MTIMLLASLAAGCATQTTPLRRETVPRVTHPAPAPLPAPVFTPADVAAPGLPASPRMREVILHALSQIGARYQNAGRTPETGFDCSGLVQYVLGQAAGILLPRDTWSMSQVGLEVSGNELQPGDLVFFNTLGRAYSHVGIYLGGWRFIHAPTQGGTVSVVDMRAPYWQSRFDGARRLDL